MNIRSLIKFLTITLLIAFSISCHKIEKIEKTYSAAEEKALRDRYINNLIKMEYVIDTTDVGIYYIVVNEGEGDFAKKGDTLTVKYGGWFLDNVLFDSSEIHYSDGKMKFTLGDPPMITGWDHAMEYMNRGAKIQFIIPSEMAYGESGFGNIPPYQTLVFMVELFEINPVTQ